LTIDAMPILAGLGGISNYVNPLVFHFLRISESAFQTALHFRTGSPNRMRKFKTLQQNCFNTEQSTFLSKTNLPDRILKLFWQSKNSFLGKLTLPETDIYLATTEMMPLHARVKRVAIIHDLTPAVIPQFFADSKHRYLTRLKSVIENCHTIVAVSETTAKDISRFFDIDSKIITVIYGGQPSIPTADTSDDSILKKLGVKKPFILYVGALAPNKNIEGTIRCFASFTKKTRLDWQLILVGKNFMPHGYYEEKAREEGILDRVIFTGWLDKERWALFRNAEILLHLSWYEGFGIPLLEAMVSGLPILASNRGSLPEVLHHAAQIVDPQNEEAIVDKLQMFAEFPKIGEQWKRCGARRAGDFSWERSASTLFETLKRAVEDSR